MYEDVCPTLQSFLGTGGGNVPCIVDCLNPWDGQGNKVYSKDGLFPTLRSGRGYPNGMVLDGAEDETD